MGRVAPIVNIVLPVVLLGLSLTGALSFAEETKSMLLSGSIALKSDYVASSGEVIGQGPVQQNYLRFGLDKRLTLSLFTNYDFGDAELNEYDVWATFHSSPFSIPRGVFKGSLLGRITVEKWFYPGYEPDYATSAGVFYSGPFDADVDYLKVLTHGWSHGDEKVSLQLSRTFKLFETEGMNVTWTPSLKTAYNHHYFDKMGWGHVTPGLGLDLISTNWTLSASIKKQFGANEIQDLTYYEISLSANNILN